MPTHHNTHCVHLRMWVVVVRSSPMSTSCLRGKMCVFFKVEVRMGFRLRLD